MFAALHERLPYLDYQYVSVPSMVDRDTIERQGVVAWEQCFRVGDELALAGSAEQGFLQLAKDRPAQLGRYWAHNQCFRKEKALVPWLRQYEFLKTELYVICDPADWEGEYEQCLRLGESFMGSLGYTVRRRDCTRDPGYHRSKTDLEVLTRRYGWVETHSCTYFGDEQAMRLGMCGPVHTVSCTGAASPRILLPWLEEQGLLDV